MIVFVAMIAFVVYFNSAYTLVCVSGSSMFPTLESGDVLFMAKVNITEDGEISTENGDIIVINNEKFDIDGESHFLIKRQIAKGQAGKDVVVEIIDGYVYVDGEMLQEEYLLGQGITEPAPKGQTRWELKENEIFYLGDNREVSLDSRVDKYGLCDYSQVEGVVKESAISFKWLSQIIYKLSDFIKGIFNN